MISFYYFIAKHMYASKSKQQSCPLEIYIEDLPPIELLSRCTRGASICDVPSCLHVDVQSTLVTASTR